VKRVLITGMAGTGKSSLLHEFAARGYRTVDTDYGDYFQTIDGELLWREDRVSMLLSSAPDELPGVPESPTSSLTTYSDQNQLTHLELGRRDGWQWRD
jgi:GTPase SAR1 family protein